MVIYAESSAVLSWMLGEAEARDVVRCLRSAEVVLSSHLTIAECARALVRLEQDGSLSPRAASRRRALLDDAARSWSILVPVARVWERAGAPFPVEPVRTLDALHLTLAEKAARERPDLAVLSRDRRIRENAVALGLAVLPEVAR